MKQYILGVDIGGTNIKIGIFDSESIELIDKIEFKTPKRDQDQSIFLNLKSEIDQLIKNHKLVYEDVIGLGVAVPCPVKNGYVFSCPNLVWTNMDIVKELQKSFPSNIKISVSNDASLAALGENESLDMPYKNAVLITLGTGVGGGVIINGNIHEGSMGYGGEIGHIRVFDENEITCGCGSKGCLEQICGTHGILEYTQKLAKNSKTSIDMNRLSVKSVFDAAKDGDNLANKVIDRVAKYLAISASILAMIVDPEVFIIGGGVSRAGSFLIDKIEKHYKSEARFSSGHIPFMLAKTGNDAGIIGAAYLVSQQIKKSEKTDAW
ncbi:MAG: ROK family protein [Acholeplasmataceae bacterium]|nr:ROK family protein [Acholeplasmataceae bacterium]